MTEPKQASALNFFSAAAPAGKKGATSFGAVDTAQPIDSTFSRELVRANERSDSSNRRRDNSQRDAFEPGAHESPKRTEPQRSSTAESSARSDARPARAPDKPSSSSADKIASASNAKDVRKSDKNTGASEEGEGVKASEQDRVSQATTASDSDSVPVDESASTALKTPVVPGTSLQVTQTDAEVVSVDADDSVPTDAATGVDEDATAKKVVTPSHLVDAPKAAAVQLPGSVVQEDLTTAKRPAVAFVDGKPLSPAQLANRQAHLLNTPLARDAKPVQTTAQPAAGESSEGELTVTLNRLVSPGGVTLAGVASHANNQPPVTEQPAAATLVAGVMNKPGLSGEATIANVSQRMQNAELAATAEADARLVAQQAKQEVMQENLVQTRQIAQQQVLNVNPALQAVSAVPVDSGNQVADNMFLSLPGGIVTAPVLQRAEAGNTQLINAPINMPILQDDADKAMSGNIRWMVNEGVKNAVVNVTPSGMGPISVSIGMDKDQMSVAIVAMQGSTREALDSMLPRLREQLAAQGHENVKVDISDGRPNQSDRGYGQQFSGDQAHSEQGERAMGTQVADEESGNAQTNETSVAAVSGQAQIMVGNDGQIRRSYDVYV